MSLIKVMLILYTHYITYTHTYVYVAVKPLYVFLEFDFWLLNLNTVDLETAP